MRCQQNATLAAVVEWIALAICVSATLLLLGLVALRCRHGFDFTDEGFYLNWISNPSNYQGSASQFGFVYHPLYRLVGSDVALLRQANVLIVFVLSCVLCMTLVRSFCPDWTALRLSQRVGFAGGAAAVASSSLTFFDPWLPTPSYNSLALQSLVMTVVGALLAGRKLSIGSIAGWILIGFGGGFAFLAKPTTAAMLACLITGYVIMAGKFSLRGPLVAMTTAILLLVIAALAIDGSLSIFLGRLVKGVEMVNSLAPDKHLFRWDHYELSQHQKTRFDYLLIATYLSTALGLLASKRAQLGATLIAALLAAISIATAAGLLFQKIQYEPFQQMLFLAISLGIALSSILVSPRPLVSRSGLALILLFILLPHAYAFGTNNNLWVAASHAGLFWILAGFVVSVELAATSGNWRALLPVAGATLLVSTVIVSTAIENPYRQTEPLRLQTSEVDINRVGAPLFLTEQSASYIREISRLANENGFRTGDYMLDLTGVSPGSLYAMGARPLGTAWTIGGYPGSANLLTALLDQETCNAIGASWILTEPNSRDAFSPDLLRRFGIDLLHDYRIVGSVSSIRDPPPTRFENRLLKPVRSLEAARLACEEARSRDRTGRHP
jgi:hypothetical protein